MISVAVLTEEHKAMYKHTEEDSMEMIAGEERQRPLNEQQLFWQNKTRGRWTAVLPGNIAA